MRFYFSGVGYVLVFFIMRQSQLFSKTRKEAPGDEVSKNAQLLIRAGYINKEMAGVYALLPLGLRVIENIKQIVREEMNVLGTQELLMTSLQPKEVWERTKRWDDAVVDVWFKSELAAGGDVGLAWSHEEPIGEMMKGHISSYKDLPVCVYQFQTKLRNELRAKSGIMRGREFVMKDAYSFCIGEEDHNHIYDAMKEAYMNVFRRTGIGNDTYITFASGGAFTEFSHEFQTVCEVGEDVCYVSKEKGIAINDEVMNEGTLSELGVAKNELEKVHTVEVGNIFNFGRKKAKDLGLLYKNKEGESLPVWMGSYGLGITRLAGVLVEKFADDKGLVWPKEVAPFVVHLVRLGEGKEVTEEADSVYNTLTTRGVSVLYDDRAVRPGEKFADSDLLGIPTRVVVSERNLAQGVYEVVDRASGAQEMLSKEAVFALF